MKRDMGVLGAGSGRWDVFKALFKTAEEVKAQKIVKGRNAVPISYLLSLFVCSPVIADWCLIYCALQLRRLCGHLYLEPKTAGRNKDFAVILSAYGFL